LPFCHLAIKAEKPKPTAYPAVLDTLGDQLRAKRLDLVLHQKDVAAIIGVTEDTICYWEINRVKPSKRLLPLIKGFLDGVDKTQG
jgi:DNA-binding transcriptional regulator YiaG